MSATQAAVMFVSALLDAVPHNFSCHLFRNKIARQVTEKIASCNLTLSNVIFNEELLRCMAL